LIIDLLFHAQHGSTLATANPTPSVITQKNCSHASPAFWWLLETRASVKKLLTAAVLG